MVKSLTIGAKIRIIIDPPNGTPLNGVVKILQDNVPGKKVGVELDNYCDYAHSLDQTVSEKTDPIRGITVGRGWWTTADNVEIL